MATLGNLSKLPLELRKEIYAYVLVESDGEAIGITQYLSPRTDVQQGKRAKVGTAQVVRAGHHRNKNHRGQIWDKEKKIWNRAPPSNTSILRLSKAFHAEAAPVFYGQNCFWFSNSSALTGFLFRIGDSKQHIRHIILGGPFMLWGTWASTDRCIHALLEVKSLRTLEIFHCQFENNFKVLSMQDFMAHCMPLLASLHASIEARNLNYSILDVVEICFWNNPRQPMTSGQRQHGLKNMTDEDRAFVATTKNEIKKQLQLADD